MSLDIFVPKWPNSRD